MQTHALYTRAHEVDHAFKVPHDEVDVPYAFLSVLPAWTKVHCWASIDVVVKDGNLACETLEMERVGRR